MSAPCREAWIKLLAADQALLRLKDELWDVEEAGAVIATAEAASDVARATFSDELKVYGS